MVEMNRETIDRILGKSDNRLDFENKICRIFGYKNYHDANARDRKIIGKIQYLVLEQEIKTIELTLRDANEKH